MSHNLDMSKGFAAFAHMNEPGWHKLGQQLTGKETREERRALAGMDFSILKSPVTFAREKVGLDGKPDVSFDVFDNQYVLYRSDTGAPMNVVTGRYNIVQPLQIEDWIERLCKENGFTLDTLGVICGGARYWALCKTENGIVLPGQDKVAEYICATTSCDGSTSTEAIQTAIRVVCNNTLDLSLHDNVLSVKTRHSTEWNADAVQIKLGVGKAWADWAANATRLAKAKVKNEETIKLFFNAYYGLDTDEKIKEKINKDTEKGEGTKLQTWMQKMLMCLQSSPGADLASARGTLWGAINAVTYDIDHNGIGRTDEARFINSRWGKGADVKQRMWDAAVALV